MNATSKHSTPLTLRDTPSVTSSPELADGALPSDSRDGQMTDLFGRAVVLVNPSVRRVPILAAPIPAIFGQRGITSSASAALQSSLVSRLKARLPTGGSTLFAMTWNEKATPSGRLVSLLQASALRTSDSDSGSSQKSNQRESIETKMRAMSNCSVTSATTNHSAASVAAGTANISAEIATNGRIPFTTISQQADASNAAVLTWLTPSANEDASGGMSGTMQLMMSHQVRGLTINSPLFTPEDYSRLRVSIAFWLQGYPLSWISCAVRVMPSSRKSRQRLSPPIKR